MPRPAASPGRRGKSSRRQVRRGQGSRVVSDAACAAKAGACASSSATAASHAVGLNKLANSCTGDSSAAGESARLKTALAATATAASQAAAPMAFQRSTSLATRPFDKRGMMTLPAPGAACDSKRAGSSGGGVAAGV